MVKILKKYKEYLANTGTKIKLILEIAKYKFK
jgi:hypothetical protein